MDKPNIETGLYQEPTTNPRIVVVLTRETLACLKAEAKRQRRPFSQLARIYIEDGLKREEEGT